MSHHSFFFSIHTTGRDFLNPIHQTKGQSHDQQFLEEDPTENGACTEGGVDEIGDDEDAGVQAGAADPVRNGVIGLAGHVNHDTHRGVADEHRDRSADVAREGDEDEVQNDEEGEAHA